MKSKEEIIKMIKAKKMALNSLAGFAWEWADMQRLKKEIAELEDDLLAIEGYEKEGGIFA